MRFLSSTLAGLAALSGAGALMAAKSDPARRVTTANREPEPEKSRQVRRQEERERKKGRRDVLD